MIHRFCDDRTCALNAPYTLCLQSQDAPTLLAGLRALLQERDFTAHMFSNEAMWGAWIPMESLEQAERLAGRLAAVTEAMGHAIRILVEDEMVHVIEVDRTYDPDGGVNEPLKAW